MCKIGRSYFSWFLLVFSVLRVMPLHNRDELTYEVARAVVVYKTVKKYPCVSWEVRTKTIDYWVEKLFFWRSRYQQKQVLYTEALFCCNRVSKNIDAIIAEADVSPESSGQPVVESEPHIHPDEVTAIILYFVRVLYEFPPEDISDNDVSAAAGRFWEYCVKTYTAKNQLCFLGSMEEFARTLVSYTQISEKYDNIPQQYSFNEVRDVLRGICKNEGGDFGCSIGNLVKWWHQHAGVVNKEGGITTGLVTEPAVVYTPIELCTLCRMKMVKNNTRNRAPTEKFDPVDRKQLRKAFAANDGHDKLRVYVLEKSTNPNDIFNALPSSPNKKSNLVGVRRSVRSRAQSRA